MEDNVASTGARDREVLLRFARERESNAEFVSSWAASKEGFWPLAVQLLALHLDDHANLAVGRRRFPRQNVVQAQNSMIRFS